MTVTLLILTSAVLAAVSCGRLEPQYLPPRGGYATSGASSGAFSGANSGAYSGASSVAGSYSGAGANIPILRYDNVNNGDGSYRYNYETANGISAQESGSARGAGAVTSQGSFSYRAPDGRQVALTYTADERGFHPVGDHLPTPPPIPEAILRSIEFNRRNPSSEGAYNPAADGSNSGGYQY